MRLFYCNKHVFNRMVLKINDDRGTNERIDRGSSKRSHTLNQKQMKVHQLIRDSKIREYKKLMHSCKTSKLKEKIKANISKMIIESNLRL